MRRSDRSDCRCRQPHGRCLAAVVLAASCWLAACGTEQADVPDSYVRISIDRSEPERLLDYYFGGYVSPEAADPFEAGVLRRVSDGIYVDRSELERNAPEAVGALRDEDGDGRIDWEELESFVDQTYNRAREAPDSLDALLRSVALFDFTDSTWMRVDVHGVMTTARREIYVRETAVRDALRHYVEGSGELIYPDTTTFIAQHTRDERVLETTVMRKRPDGHWDYFVYDASGLLAPGTSTQPRDLKSPIQCVGCHFGDKLLEPERSFPASARPGPHGPRAVHVDDRLRDEAVVQLFDEHRRRSDAVLGLYTTLFVSRLRAQLRDGVISSRDEALLDSLALKL